MDGSAPLARDERHEQETLGQLVRRARRAFVRALSAELAPFGISNAEWSALRVLWRRVPPTQVELAEELLVEKASVTPVLAGLERKGLVERRRDPSDRRKTRLILTPRGRALEATLLPVGESVNARAEDGLSAADHAALREGLRKVLAALGA